MKRLSTSIEKDKEKQEVFGDRYTALLAKTENHEDIDYHRGTFREDTKYDPNEDSEFKVAKADAYIKKYTRINNILRRFALLSDIIMLILIEGIKYFI